MLVALFGGGLWTNGGFGYIIVFCFYLQTVFVGIHVEPQDHCTHTSWKV
jgi:hypothetical protein